MPYNGGQTSEPLNTQLCFIPVHSALAFVKLVHNKGKVFIKRKTTILTAVLMFPLGGSSSPGHGLCTRWSIKWEFIGEESCLEVSKGQLGGTIQSLPRRLFNITINQGKQIFDGMTSFFAASAEQCSLL